MKYTFADKRALNCLRVCGNANLPQLNTIISKNRIRTWEKIGLIKRVPYQDKKISRTKSCYTYRLTKAGKSVASKILGNKHFTISRTQERHNHYLADAYCKLPPEQQIIAMNEHDSSEFFHNQAYELIEQGLKNEGNALLDELKNTSYVDMIVVTETEINCYEVITSNYTTDDCQNHSHFTEIIHATSYEIINIH